MMKSRAGVLYCTSKALCAALGLTGNQLRVVQHRYGARLNPLSVTECNAYESEDIKGFLQRHKETFDVKRVREDMLLWPLREALGVAFHVHTEVAWEFHQAAIDLVVHHSQVGAITWEQYEFLSERVRALEDIQAGARSALEDAASAAGLSLQAHRGTKVFRSQTIH